MIDVGEPHFTKRYLISTRMNGRKPYKMKSLYENDTFELSLSKGKQTLKKWVYKFKTGESSHPRCYKKFEPFRTRLGYHKTQH
jgi:hypothetical protein